MEVKVLIVLLIALCGCASAQVALRWFNVPVGHYNPLIRRFFDLRYFANSEHYVPGGPIYIYIGGGIEVYDDFLTQGAMFEIARDTGGYLFALEHRYYGESRPTDNAAVNNLAFLTIHQAVADIGEFISFIKANYNEAQNSRVILWGKGYGGALAVWARHKFHHNVNGVWASSAPLNAMPENQDFMRNVAYTISSIGGAECNQVLSDAFRMIDDAVRLRNTTYLENRFRLCSPVDVHIAEDVSRLFYGIASEIGYEFLSNARYPEVDDICTIMRGLNTPNDLPENALDALARWFVDDFNREKECLNYNNTAIVEMYQNVEWDSESTVNGLRQTFWLQCSQLGQFATSGNGNGHPFGWRFDFEFFHRWCSDVFGIELFDDLNFMEETIAKTNVFYGGMNPEINNVFLTHGEMDPSRSLGPNEDLNPQSPVVVMSLQSFGRDFGSADETDYAVLQQTKARARELILQWIETEPTLTELPPTTEDAPAPAY